MSKLIETRLPICGTPDVAPSDFNRLVRVLEINLNRFDPDATLQISTVTRDEGGLQATSSLGEVTVGTDGNVVFVLI